MALRDTDLPRIPEDTFAVRLAIVRAALGGLNIRAAAEYCTLSPENWRRWEKGQQPHDQSAVARQIAQATGFDYVWIMAGGPLLTGRYTAYGQVRPALELTRLPGPDQLTLDDAPRYDMPVAPVPVRLAS